MTSIYVNYPNPHFSIYLGKSVEECFRHQKEMRRVIRINHASFSKEMACIAKNEIQFASNQDLNDLWIELDFGDSEFESELGRHIQKLLGKRYIPLAKAKWN